MQTNRVNNISLFVTVLSACLLAAGTPALVLAHPAQSVDLSSVKSEKSECGSKVLKIAKRSPFQSSVFRPRIESDFQTEATEQVFEENTRSLVSRNDILIVTRLPRAGLVGRLAEQPAAN